MKFYSILVGTLTTLIVLFFALPHTPLLLAELSLAFTGLFYIHIEPFFLTNTKINLEIGGITEPVKIVFLADIQIGKHKRTAWINRIIKKINKINPDLILFGGDLISNELFSTDAEAGYLLKFKELSAKYPVVTVLGNHEYGYDFHLRKNEIVRLYPDRHEMVMSSLREAGVKILRNELVELTLKNSTLSLYGTDDVWAGKDDWAGVEKSKHPLVVLTHNADSLLKYPEQIKKPELVLSGHTHNGQIFVPGFGPIGNANIKLGRAFYYGLVKFKDFLLFVTRGAGESSFAIRFCAPPEIVSITLLPKA
jgi:predicted MPP superfamily phosphohydrolase